MIREDGTWWNADEDFVRGSATLREIGEEALPAHPGTEREDPRPWRGRAAICSPFAVPWPSTPARPTPLRAAGAGPRPDAECVRRLRGNALLIRPNFTEGGTEKMAGASSACAKTLADANDPARYARIARHAGTCTHQAGGLFRGTGAVADVWAWSNMGNKLGGAFAAKGWAQRSEALTVDLGNRLNTFHEACRIINLLPVRSGAKALGQAGTAVLAARPEIAQGKVKHGNPRAKGRGPETGMQPWMKQAILMSRCTKSSSAAWPSRP